MEQLCDESDIRNEESKGEMEESNNIVEETFVDNTESFEHASFVEKITIIDAVIVEDLNVKKIASTGYYARVSLSISIFSIQIIIYFKPQAKSLWFILSLNK